MRLSRLCIWFIGVVALRCTKVLIMPIFSTRGADVSLGSRRTKVLLMPIFSTRGADVSQVMKVKFRGNFKKTS